MIDRLNDLTQAKKNFAFETTCAGNHHIQTLQKCRVFGYHLNLIFYWLPSVEMAIQRVKYRVQQGGHDIPEDTIRRRYQVGLRNLVRHYLPLVDTAMVLDNSGFTDDQNGLIFAEKSVAGDLLIADGGAWRQILDTAAKE